MKVGYGGFHPEDRNSSTKSFKRSWQAETAGARIKFRFYGSSVKVAMWQRRDGMGVIHAHVDDDTKHIAKASGFFKVTMHTSIQSSHLNVLHVLI